MNREITPYPSIHYNVYIISKSSRRLRRIKFVFENSKNGSAIYLLKDIPNIRLIDNRTRHIFFTLFE